jgi:hypothetical protein
MTDKPLLHRRRTVVHIDWIEAGRVGCSPAGVDLPAASTIIPLSDFSVGMQVTAEPGKVFFATANLDADRMVDVDLRDIEEGWGRTDFPLHFEEADHG